jgi:lipopolysaccharide biosynthesis glycosyltransferase
MPSAVMITSVSINNAYSDVTFHILIDGSVEENQKEQLKNSINNNKHHIVFHNIDRKLFERFPMVSGVKHYITLATYYRLLIPSLLPEEIHKVIYLDGDMIVRRPLDKLWNTDIEKYAVGVVTDMEEDKHDYKRLGYDKSFGYFNAGMLLINLDYWREHKLEDVFFKLIAEEPERIILHDQDVLNITLHNQKLNLPKIFNVQSGFLRKPEYSGLGNRYEEYKNDIIEAIKEPVIIHYTDKFKPWHIEDSNPYGYEFMKYYKQTEWKFCPLKHSYRWNLRHFVGTILRKLHLIPPTDLEDYKFYSFEDIQSLT